MKTQPSVLAGVAGALVLVLTAVGCGKKGPPLAPLPQVPAAVEEPKVRRVGSTVYLQFRIPSANQDGTRPAEIARVDVYGYTGPPGRLDDFLKYGTLVARVPVRRPPEPDQEDRKKGQKGKKGKPEQEGGTSGRDSAEPLQRTGLQPAPRPVPQPVPQKKKPVTQEPGFDQGAVVTVTEEITQAVITPVTVRPRKGGAPPVPPPAPGSPFWLDEDPGPIRVYIVLGFNRHGRRGAPARMLVPLLSGAGPPAGLQVAYTEDTVSAAWEPPRDARRVVQDPVLMTNLSSTPLGDTWCRPVQDRVPGQNLPSRSLGLACDTVQALDPIKTLAATTRFFASAASRYNVYATSAAPSASPPPALPGGLPAFEMPVPLNDKPLELPAFSEKRGEFGVERCYIVRTVDTFGPTPVESAASMTACVTPKDVFPPAAPKGLGAVSSGGTVNLIWEPNTEPDLAGYLVLRGEAPGAVLQPITPVPIRETTFRDANVKVGVRYVYAVVAIDTATPPNRSGESNRVEETAR